MPVGFIKKSLLGLAVFYAICLLVSIWTNFINPEIMAKITLTVFILGGLLLVIYAIGHMQSNSDADLKKDGFLQD